jgi:hypothetical protein
MIRRGSALLCWSLAAMTLCNRSTAGVWGTDPVLGLTGDYSTNQALLNTPHTAESHGAVLLDAPTTYNSNDWKLFVTPSFRVSDTAGYSSVTSDYERLNVKGELDTERGTVSATAGFSRDSSLYFNYLSDGSAGVRRDSATADVNWDRLLTERVEFNADVNSQQVRYGKAVGVGTLTDYKYTSLAPTLSWITSERGKFTLAASVGRYSSLDGTTESRSANLQLGFVRQLSETWSVTAAGGFSRALNRVDTYELVPFGPYFLRLPIHEKSSQNGTVYSVNLTRQGERLSLNAVASRQVLPTGFAYLSRQDSYELRAGYQLSTRWSLGADAREVKYQYPQFLGPATDVSVMYFNLIANWRWTEHWTVSLGASRAAETVPSSHYNVASNEVTLTLSRTFNHIEFQ